MTFHQSSHFPSRPQPKVIDSCPTYTNCVVTLIWADGVPRTPPIMFTADQKFRKTGIHTATQKATFPRFQNLLATNGVNENQIVYVGGTKHSIAESKDIVEKFLATVEIPPGATFFLTKAMLFPVMGPTSSPNFVVRKLPPIHSYFTIYPQ